MTVIKSSLAALTDIGDIAIDPSTFTINALTPDGIKQITTSSGVMTAAKQMDERPGVVEKPFAIKVSVDDFERLSHNNTDHLLQLIQDANERLRHAVLRETRCGNCPNVEIKVQSQEDLARASTNHLLTASCGLRKAGITKVVCPDGRVLGAAGESLYMPEPPTYIPEVTPKDDPDKPMTSFDEAW